MCVCVCVYRRYLDVYERIHFLGEEVDRRESEMHEEDDARNRRKALRLLHATPTSYNTSQHQIPGNHFQHGLIITQPRRLKDSTTG